MEIFILTILILINGFFALSELAVVSSRRARLQQYALEGRSGAATALRLAEDPTGAAPAGTLLLGDFNAYAEEDPMRWLKANGWSDAFALAGVEAPYSYVYDGQSGRLDHALLDAGLAARLRGAAEWHNSADESERFGYALDDDADPWRASDHDPVLLGLDLAR